MTTINVSLPDDLNHFVERQTQACGFGTASEHVQLLVARAKQGSERLESLFEEGLDSGQPIRFDDQWRQSIRRRVNDSLNPEES